MTLTYLCTYGENVQYPDFREEFGQKRWIFTSIRKIYKPSKRNYYNVSALIFAKKLQTPS